MSKAHLIEKLPRDVRVVVGKDRDSGKYYWRMEVAVVDPINRFVADWVLREGSKEELSMSNAMASAFDAWQKEMARLGQR